MTATVIRTLTHMTHDLGACPVRPMRPADNPETAPPEGS
jgi:hypothetical protein